MKKDMVESFDENKEIRLNKFLSDAGACSRREADRLIEAGKVTVDGKPAVVGMKILPSQTVICDGRPVTREEEFILIALNKPKGIECTTSRDVPENIIDFINYPKRIYPIGRLDKGSEGLILLTNNGAIVNKILKAVNHHEKEYIVIVDHEITEDFIRKMSQGVPILDTVTRKCEVRKMGEQIFKIVLTQGLNRQIRRMCEYLGYKVVRLKRVRIMNIELGDLKKGCYRDVTPKEIEQLLGSF
ncbi:pseudouridine synthase [Parasporobacterium paucivorans]